jgi:hypothetical protein
MTSIASEKDKYKLPDWAGRPPKGTHLDVVKGPKLIQVSFSLMQKLSGDFMILRLNHRILCERYMNLHEVSSLCYVKVVSSKIKINQQNNGA